jgi:hypothetical protein
MTQSIPQLWDGTDAPTPARAESQFRDRPIGATCIRSRIVDHKHRASMHLRLTDKVEQRTLHA